jgi:hypothetical protein
MPLRSRGCFYSLELTKDQFRTALAFTHVERPSSGSTRASSMKMRSPLCSISSSFGAGSSLIAHRQSRFARIIRHVPFYNSHSHFWWCSLGSLCGLQNCRCFLAHCKHSGNLLICCEKLRAPTCSRRSRFGPTPIWLYALRPPSSDLGSNDAPTPNTRNQINKLNWGAAVGLL